MLWPYTSDAELEVDVAVTLDPATPVAIAVDAHRNRSSSSPRPARSQSSGSAPTVSSTTRQAPSEVDGGDTYRAAWAATGTGLLGAKRADPDRQPYLDGTPPRSRRDRRRRGSPNAPRLEPEGGNRNTVYKPDGSLRYRLLPEQAVRGVRTSARYAYITSHQGRFSVDLHTGRVTRTADQPGTAGSSRPARTPLGLGLAHTSSDRTWTVDAVQRSRAAQVSETRVRYEAQQRDL